MSLFLVRRHFVAFYTWFVDAFLSPELHCVWTFSAPRGGRALWEILALTESRSWSRLTVAPPMADVRTALYILFSAAQKLSDKLGIQDSTAAFGHKLH